MFYSITFEFDFIIHENGLEMKKRLKHGDLNAMLIRMKKYRNKLNLKYGL